MGACSAYAQDTTVKKLLLCSGPHTAPYGDSDWFRVDQDPKCEPDLVATVHPLPNRLITMRPWDRVALIHGIEHFTPWDAASLLSEIRTILAPDSILILEQPDLLKCESNAAWIFGDPSSKNPGMLHRWGYRPNDLSDLVLSCGFKRTVVKPALFHMPDRDFRLEAHVTL